MNKLYLISQTVNLYYDTYHSAVVCAESEEEARTIHPAGDEWGFWDTKTWAAPGDVKVMYLGRAVKSVKKGVVCASYQAG